MTLNATKVNSFKEKKQTAKCSRVPHRLGYFRRLKTEGLSDLQTCSVPSFLFCLIELDYFPRYDFCGYSWGTVCYKSEVQVCFLSQIVWLGKYLIKIKESKRKRWVKKKTTNSNIADVPRTELRTLEILSHLTLNAILGDGCYYYPQMKMRCLWHRGLSNLA